MGFEFSEGSFEILLRNSFMMENIMRNFYVTRTFEQYFAGKAKRYLIESNAAMTS